MMDDLFDQIDNNSYSQKMFLANENGKLVSQKSHLSNTVFTGYYDPIYALRTLVFPNNSVSLGTSLVNTDTGTGIIVQATKGAFTNDYDYYNYAKLNNVVDRAIISPDNVVTLPEETVYPIGYVRRAVVKVDLFGEWDSFESFDNWVENAPYPDPQQIDILTPPFNDFPANTIKPYYQVCSRWEASVEYIHPTYGVSPEDMPSSAGDKFSTVTICIIRSGYFLVKFFTPITPTSPFVGFAGYVKKSHTELPLELMQGWYIATFTVLWTPQSEVKSWEELDGRYKSDSYIPVEETYISLPFIWAPFASNPRIAFGRTDYDFLFITNSAIPIHINRNGIYHLKNVEYQSTQPVRINKWKITYSVSESDTESGVYTLVGQYFVETDRVAMPQTANIEIVPDHHYGDIIVKLSLPAGSNNAKHFLEYVLYADYSDTTKQYMRITVLNTQII
jgi:hypothetical protein